jgi:Flp pilus assembly protein TadD
MAPLRLPPIPTVRAPRALAGLLAILVACLPAAALAQPGASLRVLVLDERGQPMPDVDVTLEFKGEPGVRPQTFKSRTNRKGYVVRMGLPPGAYKLTFSRPGYLTYVVETSLSLGGLSEIPDVVMKPAPAAETPGAPPAASAGEPGPGMAPTPPAETDLATKLKEEYAKAYEATQAGRYDEAERLYKDILAKAPGLAVVHFNLGYVYRQKKDFAAAEEQYRRAVELEPDRSDGYLALANVHELKGDHDRALQILEEAAPRFENDARFQLALGVKRRDMGRPGAREAIEKARALDPAGPEPYYHLGTIALAENRPAEALALLEKYVSMSGQNPENLAVARALIEALKKPKK